MSTKIIRCQLQSSKKKKVKLQSSKKSGKKVGKCRQKSSGANYSLVKKKK